MAVPGKKSGQELSSTVFLASDEDFQVFCEPCDRDGPRLPAYGFCTNCKEHLCESCFNHHRRATLSRHHTLLDKDSMPQTLQVLSAPASVGQSGEFIEPCAKHTKEVIKFYCHDHDALLCSVCVTLEHTVTSCKINYIPDISGEAVNSQEYHGSLEKIDLVTEKCKNAAEDTKRMIVKSNSYANDVLADIDKFREEINQKIDKLEKQSKDAVSQIRQANDKRLEAIKATYKDVIKSLKASADLVKQLNISKQADRLFVELKKADKNIKNQEDRLFQISTSGDIKLSVFEPNKEISSILDTERSLGTLTFKAEHHSTTPDIPVKANEPSPVEDALSPGFSQSLHKKEVPVKSEQHSRQTKEASHPTQHSNSEETDVVPGQMLQGEIAVRTSQDKDRCWITGMGLFTPDRLIATDFNNCSLKMIDTHTYSVVDQIKLSDLPWDVTLVTGNELAVTLPKKHKIQLVSVSSSSLTKMHVLTVDGECRGISGYKEKIVVSFQKPGKLQILNTTGKILTTVKTNSTCEDIFKVPDYVTAGSSYIYVSDCVNKTVTMLNWMGQVTGNYCCKGIPKGLALHDDGSIYLCDNALSHNTIHKISGDCTHGNDVLEGIMMPFAVCMCSKKSQLYISCYARDDTHDQFIKVYKMG